MQEEYRVLIDKAMQAGASAAGVIGSQDVVFDRVFREMCAANACGMYGKCWMCPPDIGESEVLEAQTKAFSHVLVYQSIGILEDSFDIEGMAEARQKHYALSRKIGAMFADQKVLHLGAGGCGACEVCAKRDGLPCRHPELAISSLEAYGIHVSSLAASAGMKYINGADTVTYFGAVFF